MLYLLCLGLLMGGSLETDLEIDLAKYEIFAAAPVTVTVNGTMLVIQEDDCQVLVFGKDGSLIRRIGNKGQGPGEFQRPNGLYPIDGENNFWVNDPANGRYSRWNLEGKVLEEVSYPPGMFWFINFIPNSQLVFARDVAGHMTGRPHVSRYDLKTKQEVPLWEKPLDAKPKLTRGDLDGRPVARLLEWDPKIVLATGKSFAVMTWNASDMVHKVDFEGNTIGKPFKIVMPRSPLTKDDVERQIKEWPEAIQRALRPNIVMRDEWPLVWLMRVDTEDRIWCWSFPRDGSQPLHTKVYSKDGKDLATFRMPYGANLITKDFLYVMAVDANKETATLQRVKYSL